MSIQVDRVWVVPSSVEAGDTVIAYWDWRETEGRRGTVVFGVYADGSQVAEETTTVEPLISATSQAFFTSPGPGTYSVCVQVKSWMPEEMRGMEDQSVIAMLKQEGLSDAEIASIPYGTTDIVIAEALTSFSPSSEEVARRITNELQAEHPEAEVTRVIVKKTGDYLLVVRRKVFVCVKSPLAPAVAALIIKILALIGFIVLTWKVLNVLQVRMETEATREKTDVISDVLNDPYLTPEQKQKLIEALTEAWESGGGSWTDILKMGLVGGGLLILGLIALKAMEGKK